MKEIADVLVALEVGAFLYVLYRSGIALAHLWQESKVADEGDWLLHGFRNYIAFVMLAAAYLLFLTLLGAITGPLSVHFPLIRPINGAILLGLMSGGYLLDRGVRNRNKS